MSYPRGLGVMLPPDGTATITDTWGALPLAPVPMLQAQPSPAPQPAPIPQPFPYAPPPISISEPTGSFPVIAPPIQGFPITPPGQLEADPIFAPPLNVTAAPPPVAVVPVAPSTLSTTVGGIPVWVLAAGALGAFFLLRGRRIA